MVSRPLFSQRGAVAYTKEDGLVSNQVNDLLFDNDGFLWIATDNGVSRFDGQRFQEIQLNRNSPEYNHQVVNKLTLIAGKEIWAGTQENGLVCIDAKQLVPLSKNGLVDQINAIGGEILSLKSIANKLWFSASHRGVYVVDFDQQSVKNFLKNKGSNVTEILEDEVNKEYVFCTSLNGIYAVNTLNGQVKWMPLIAKNWLTTETACPLNNSLFGGLQDSKGNFYFGNDRGEIIYFDQYQQVYKGFPSPFGNQVTIKDLAWRDERFIYLTIENQDVCLFDTRTKSFIQYKDDERTVQFPSCIEKNGKRLAIGTSGKGFYLHDESKIYGTRITVSFAEHYFAPNDGSFALSKNGNDYTIRTTPFHTYSTENQLSFHRVVQTTGSFGKNKLLLLTDKGLEEVSNSGIQSLYLPTGIATKKIAFISASEQQLFIVLSTSQLVISNWKQGDKKTQIVSIPKLEAKGQITGIYAIKHWLFITYQEGGIWFNTHTNQWHNLPPSLRNLKINCVQEFSTQSTTSAILGTRSRGLVFLELNGAKSYKVLNTQQGLMSNLILGITIDSHHQIWVKSPIGFMRIRTSDWKINWFEAANGIEDVEVVSHSSTGHYFWNKNACIYAPSNLPFPKRELAKPYILRAYSLNASNPVWRNSSFSSSENSIRFDFGVLDFSKSRNTRVRFRLQGVDKEWRNGSGQDGVSYFNLPGGDFTFQIEVNDNGLVSKMDFPVHVDAPIYKRWWFILLSIVLVAGSVVWFIQLRLQRIRKTERLKAQFDADLREMESKALRAQMNPHFLFNSLNSIRLFVMKNEIDTASNYIAKFSKLLRSILNHSRQDMISVYEEIATLKLYLEFERLRFDKGFDFDIAIDGQDVLDCQLPPMIIQPFVENAIWHGLMLRGDANGTINLSFSKSENRLMVKVKDNGVGRVKSQEIHSKNTLKEGSVGLQITKDRLKGLAIKTGKYTHLEIIDLYDDHQQATGTLVELIIET